MANEQNLKPFSAESVNEARESGARGGRKSGETRRRKKALRESIEEMMQKAVKDEKYRDYLLAIGVKKKAPSNQDAIVASMMLRALEGSERAFELLRDTMGEKPAEKVELNTIEINITEDED